MIMSSAYLLNYLLRGGFIFLWTGKKKTRGEFEVSVIAISPRAGKPQTPDKLLLKGKP